MTIPALRATLLEKLRSPMGQKLFRYSMASVVAVIVSNLSLLIFVGVVRMGVVLASTLATTIAAVPSYQMNRKWAWGKTGKSHLMKEVLPFWGLALLGWAFSTFSVYLMDGYAKHQHFSHLVQTALVVLVYFAAFGVLWVGKFVIFNKLMFVHHQHHLSVEEHNSADEPAAV
jgi:putative flippase GtrA